MISQQLEVLKRRKYLEYLKLLPSIREEKAKAYITLACTFAAITIFGFFAINPTLSTITQLHKKLEDQQRIKDALTQKSANLSRLEVQYEQIKTDLPLLTAVVPEIPNAPYLLGQMQALAQKNQIQITNMQSLQVDLEKQRKEGADSSFVFTVDAEGSYDKLLQFISDFSTFNRLVTFETLSLTNTVSQTGGKLVKLTVRSRAFFKP
ncbi:hypothetical protein BH11PAT1_BH11PAT1_6410 [soil metagenome]